MSKYVSQVTKRSRNMRLEVQLKYNTGFDTIEVCHNEREALEAAKGYRKRGYKVRILHNGLVCHDNRKGTLSHKARYSWGTASWLITLNPADIAL